MKNLNSLADIKDAAQMLDTSAVQWINAGPPDHIVSKLNEARGMLQKGVELSEAPLRIALVGEFNSGKTLMLNSLLDTTDLFPCLLQPTTGNVLEVRVNLRKEERRAEIQKATVNFFNQFEVESVLQHFVKHLQNQGLDGVPQAGLRNLDKLEQYVLRKFNDVKGISQKYALMSALEFIVSLQNYSEIVEREERHSMPLSLDLISASLTLTAKPDLSKGIQPMHQQIKQLHESVKQKWGTDKLSSHNLRALFPIIRRVEVDVSAWCVPFGVNDPEECNTLAFLDFPGLGAENSNARDEFLCMNEIADAHAVLVVFNGANPGSSGASTMATLFQRVGKLTAERTIVAVNRFDEFHPLPSGKTVEDYYSRIEQGTTVGFSTILVPAKNLLSSVNTNVNAYICSALCYLFDEKSKRPNWNFGDSKWFNDNKRQAAYTLYKRLQPDFKKIIDSVSSSRSSLQDHTRMSEGLDRYLEGGGVPALRRDLVKFTMDRGQRLIKEDALKEIRAAHRILEEIAPAKTGEGEKEISSEVSFAAQEFYRVLELSVADTLPSGPSEYKKLKVRTQDEDMPLWELIESEIAASITSWPEWFAILNQGGGESKPKMQKPEKAKKFGRYKHIKKQGGEVPKEFSAFDERFKATAESLTKYTLDCIREAIVYSLNRFENHPDYRAAIEHLQSMVICEKLPNMEEALPLLDVWSPSENLGGDEIVPAIEERIEEEVEALTSMSYPYDGSKPCFWNLALIIRVQVQLMKTYRDRLSRLVAAAENNFQDFFCNEVLRAEILPLVRSSLNNTDFLGEIAVAQSGKSWESVGQVLRGSVEEFKSLTAPNMAKPLRPNLPGQRDEEVEEEVSAPADNNDSVAPVAAAAAVAATAAAATTEPIVDEPETPAVEEDVPAPPPPAPDVPQAPAPDLIDDSTDDGDIDEEEFEEW